MRKRWENVREISLVSQFRLEQLLPGALQQKLFRKEAKEKKPSFVRLSRVDISEKLIVFLTNCAGPKSPTSNQHKDWDDKSMSKKHLGSRLLFRDKITWNIQFPSGGLVLRGPMFYCQREKQSWESVPSFRHLSSGDPMQRQAPWRATACLHPGGAVHHSTVFCIKTTIFQSHGGSLLFFFFFFILRLFFYTISQIGWAERLACSSVSGNARGTISKNPGMLFTEWGPASIQKVLPGEYARCYTWSQLLGLDLMLDCEGLSIPTHLSTLQGASTEQWKEPGL